MTKNQLAFEYLHGTGVELGALHNPVPLDPNKATVVYADRLCKADAIAAFPELESAAELIVESDLLVDLDNDDLSFISERGMDFVIANHVIEHVVNPIRFLKKVSDNLPVGGRFFLTVPNKEFTHDKNRKLTRYRHLWLEYYLNTKRLSNTHIKDYLRNKSEVEQVHPKTAEYFKQNNLPLSYYDGNRIPLNPISRSRLYQYHRGRSIHVHVWNRESFDFFLRRTIDLFKLKFEIEEYLSAETSAGEMIYLLKKAA
ncbi:MAG: methyltransferase domain-containing protein [Gammaproteobacteria bacterium]|nr:methyltransferase domain-containing protein [Gammaproteobacteria bacterium]